VLEEEKWDINAYIVSLLVDTKPAER